LHPHTHTHSCHQLYNTSATADYNPSKYLDTSHIGKKELAAMRSLAMRVKHSKTAYVVVGYGWMRFILNDEDKVEEMHVNWRLTSLKVRITCSFPCLYSLLNAIVCVLFSVALAAAVAGCTARPRRRRKPRGRGWRDTMNINHLLESRVASFMSFAISTIKVNDHNCHVLFT
jgi:hypothetical protein